MPALGSFHKLRTSSLPRSYFVRLDDSDSVRLGESPNGIILLTSVRFSPKPLGDSPARFVVILKLYRCGAEVFFRANGHVYSSPV